MPLTLVAGHRPATTALRTTCHRRQLLDANLPPAIRPCPSNAGRSYLPNSAFVTIDRLRRTQHLDPPRSNPHSANLRHGSPPLPRFPPLKVFVRRPSECAAPSVIGPASENLHNRVISSAESLWPLHPNERTCSVAIGSSESCHIRTHAPQQKILIRSPRRRG